MSIGGVRAGLLGGKLLEFRSIASMSSGGASTVAVPTPAGFLATDLLLVYIGVVTNVTYQAEAGWTLLRQENQGSYKTAIYYKIASGSEGASVTFDLSGAMTGAHAAMLAYKNPNAATPVLDDTVAGATDATTTVDAPSIAAPTKLGLLVTIHGKRAGTDAVKDPHAGMTERLDMGAGAGELLIAEQRITSLAATGVKTATGYTANNTDERGYSLILPD